MSLFRHYLFHKFTFLLSISYLHFWFLEKWCYNMKICLTEKPAGMVGNFGSSESLVSMLAELLLSVAHSAACLLPRPLDARSMH